MPSKKKIFDIIPPRERRKEEGKAERYLITSKKKRITFSGGKKRIFIGIFVILGVIFVFSPFLIPTKAIVEIWPKSENLEMKLNILATTKSDESNFSQSIIPASLLEEEKIISQEFSASITTTEEKARGVIRVYNKYYQPVTLIKGTRFLPSDSEAEFLSQRRITIPAGGYVDVEVVAARPGEEYNIPPSAFVIPNLRKFSPPRLYYDITGKSFAPMKGGKIAKIPKVTLSDIEKAKAVLRKKALKEARELLKEKTSKEIILLEDTIESEILEFIPLAEPGQEIKKFTVQMKIKAKGLGIKKSDLDHFIQEYIKSNFSPTKVVYLGEINTNLKTERMNLEEGRAEVEVIISGVIYSSLEKELLKEMIKGKKGMRAVQEIRERFPQVAKVKIEIKPFWRKRVPEEVENIKVKINLKGKEE